MNSTTFSQSLPAAQEAGFWHATRVVLDVLLSPRHYLAQFDEVEHLLRLARRIEAREPQRAEALRRQAFDLIN